MKDTLGYIFDINTAYHKVCGIIFNADKTIVNITINPEDILDDKEIKSLEHKIKTKYSFTRVTIVQEHININENYIDYLKEKLIKDFPSVAVYIKSSLWTLKGDTIHIEITHTLHIESVLKSIYDKLSLEGKYRVEIKYTDIIDDNNRDDGLKKAIVNQNNKSCENNTPNPEKKINTNKKSNSVEKDKAGDGSIIFGKAIKGDISDIDTLTLESHKIIVVGEVFFVEFREIKAKNLMVINFDITDKKGSVRITKVLDIDKSAPFLDNIKKGIYISVEGTVVYNNFEKELCINPKSINLKQKNIRMDNSDEKRVELHLHTIMSSMDATNDIASLIERAKLWGHKAIALTDHGVAQSFPDAMNAAKKYNIKVIYGVEAYLIDNADVLEQTKKRVKTNHQIILVKNMIGLKNLYKLVSLSHIKYFRGRAIMPRDVLNEHREGLILGSACERGEVYDAILMGKTQEEIESLAKFNDYLEIQPLMNNEFMVRKGLVKSLDDIKEFNKRIVDIGEKFNIPVVATGDVHFLEPSDEMFRRILMAGKGFTDADQQPPLYFKTTDEMLQEFEYLGKDKAREIVITNTNLIADMCEEIVPIPSQAYTPKIEGSKELLEEMVSSRATELYGDNYPKIVTDRLEKEMQSIIGNGFDVMYIIAQKLVSKSIDDGYLVGSRGSVGSSFVAFLSGITEVNSLDPHYRCEECKYCEFHIDEGFGAGTDMPDKKCPQCDTELIKDGFAIPFETFLGFDGDKAPDIDLNFSGEYQAIAHKNTIEIFGQDHVFRAGTIGTIAEKTAYGFVRKYLDERGTVCSKAEQNRLTIGCSGVKRTTGQHPGGLMIVPLENSIYEFCPVQRPADDPDSDIVTTHFDYHSIHDNLLKLDLLGHDDPTIIKILEDITGVNARDIKLDDKDTMSLFISSEKLGIINDKILGETGAAAIPEFGTKFVRNMLVETRPTTFDELVRISGLSHGTDVWVGNAQELVKNKVATLKEVICARDDIMNYLIAKGIDAKISFNIMENVRKGKGLKPEWIDLMRENSVPGWYINSCLMIKYMFPKAHAVAYVMMAFRIAWFKVHYPLAFYSAYFTVRAKAFDARYMINGIDTVLEKMKELSSKEKLTAVEKDMQTTLEVCYEFYKRGFEFAKMDIYKSQEEKFIIEDGMLVPPLTSMPGIGGLAASSIIRERENGRFLSLDELINRCEKVSNSVTELLEEIGAVDGIPKTAQVTFF